MKSKPNPASLLKVLLSVAAGVGIGWWGKGMTTGRGSGSQVPVPPSAEISRTSSSSAAPSTSQRPSGVSTEEPKAIAKRMLQAVLDGSQEKGNSALRKFRFQQALAGCDEASVAGMLEITTSAVSDSEGNHFGPNPPGWQFCELLLTRMGELNPQKALDCQLSVAKVRENLDPYFFSMVMELLTEQDLARIQNLIEGLSSGFTRASAQIAWLQARTKFDPDGVFQYLTNLDAASIINISTFEREASDLLQELGKQDPEKGLQAASLFPEEKVADLRRTLFREWLSKSQPAAEKWATEQKDAEMLNECFYFSQGSSSGLDEEFLRENFLSIQSKDPRERKRLASILAERLALKDIPESVRWIATLPIAEQAEANVGVALRWVNEDAPTAAEWLATLPSGESRDEAVGVLLTDLLLEDPEASLIWATSMTTQERYVWMERVMETLTEKDPAAAERAFQALSEDDRAVLSVMKGHKELFK